ncbi:toprim domain-containing protein, partial [Paraburkholderia sp. SIMBA_027]|uniref:toprim domain-containing protein n=1 Tax=Paraburkholderia sp. SIMBA_027 TaxID=3085770 RepID=UPI00397B729F
VYASTGGGWSPSTIDAIASAARGITLVAATDADPQGEVYADRLRAMAEALGSDFMRLRPRLGDWNEDLKENMAHARPTGSRVKRR